MSKYDETNSGALFNIPTDNPHTVIRQGNVNIDGDQRRIIAVKRNNRNGEPITALYTEIGTLKKSEDKRTEKSPDAWGRIEHLAVAGARKLSAWNKISSNNNAYISLAVNPIVDEEAANKRLNENVIVCRSDGRTQNTVDREDQQKAALDDDIPF